MRVSNIFQAIGFAIVFGATINSFCETGVPNGSFEEGDKWPLGWKLQDYGGCENNAHSGKRCVSVKGDGISDEACWTSDRFSLEPNKTYRLAWWMKSQHGEAFAELGLQGTVNCAGGGSAFPEWKQYDCIFQTKDESQSVFLKFWQRFQLAKVFLDDITITEVKPVCLKKDGIELGNGESIKDNIYFATSSKMGTGGPDARFLFKGIKKGDSDYFFGRRWFVYSSGVVFRHKVEKIKQTDASFKFSDGWNPSGKATVVFASNDGKNYKQIYEGNKLGWTDTITLPADLFPTKEIYIWFRQTASCFELAGYEYKAKLADKTPDMEGKTEFIESVK